MTAPAPRRRRRLRSGWAGYLFASPWLVGFLGLTLLPMIASLLLSFADWDGMNWGPEKPPGPDGPGQSGWKAAGPGGLDNYRRALRGIDNGIRKDLGLEVDTENPGDKFVWIALKNTFYYSFLAVPLGLMVSLGLAVLLNQKLRGINLFRTVFYMPHVIGGVATIMMWTWVFNADFGAINSMLRSGASVLQDLGLLSENWKPPEWFSSSTWSKPALIIMSVWGAGGAMLIFLAALQNVPEQLYEAADIDGAGRWSKFRHVTVPQISPAIFFNLVMGIIGSFQVFNQAYIISRGTGEPDNSLLFYVLYLYLKAFHDFEMGYASALAWILFLIILALTLIIIRSSALWVYYEGEKA